MRPRKQDRPILMSGPMVKAILERRKTQTRRVVKLQPVLRKWKGRQIIGDEFHEWPAGIVRRKSVLMRDMVLKSPYGRPGDCLWIRETWASVDLAFGSREMEPPEMVAYKADGTIYGPVNKLMGRIGGDDGITVPRWRPSIYMPKVLSRIKLDITNVCVERLSEISERDARAEGVEVREFNLFGADTKKRQKIFALHFQFIWDAINAKRGYGWDKNPWVWVIEFRISERLA